jgi:hypothetical protein
MLLRRYANRGAEKPAPPVLEEPKEKPKKETKKAPKKE